MAILIYNYSYCQTNLVPNPSFENISNCPNAASQLSLALPWFEAGTGTPDLYSICATNVDFGVPKNWYGNQLPHIGSNYSGIQCACGDYREYIQIQLSSTLTSSMKYFVSFYVSMADTFAYTSSAIGAHLSIGPLSASNYSPLPFVPQIQNASNNYFDLVNWKKISGSFLAIGGESHITIGNFNSTAATNSMIVNTNTLVYNTSCIYFYLDDICVTTDSIFNETWTSIHEENSYKILNFFPNPASGKLSISTYLPDLPANINCSIYNVIGQKLQDVIININDRFDISKYEDGLYYFKVHLKDRIIIKKVIIKSKNHEN